MSDVEEDGVGSNPGHPADVHTVLVEPRHHEFVGADGESVMAAAERAGFSWPTVCGGQGLCTTCFVLVLEGADNLTPMTSSERSTLAAVRFRFPDVAENRVRLACQAGLHGPVRLRKAGVRPRAAGATGAGPTGAERSPG